MFWLLVKKELTVIIQSPKFVATFATCSILILLSIYIGINEYNNAINQYHTAKELADNQLAGARSFHSVTGKTYRKPDPMMIFACGINNDVGRFSYISSHREVNLQNSAYTDDPIFALFRFIDFTFIVTIVFSLFAILFTYNSINGEREGGTLRLIFSNSVSRIQYLSAKFIGSWFGLVIPISIPILIGLFLLFLFNVPFSLFDWGRLLTLLFSSLLYFTFFITLGILVSSLTRQSSVSFLILLVSWIIIVFIIPRVGVMIAGQLINVPAQSEIESQLDAFSKDKWNASMEERSKEWERRNAEMEGMTEAERETYQDDNSWGWMKEDEAARKVVENEIAEYSHKLNEEFKNNKRELKRLALLLTRFSPASSYQLAAMNISTTDIDLKDRYEDLIHNYKNDFVNYVEKKREENGGMAGLRITLDSESGMKVDGREESNLDLSELPKFVDPKITYAQIFQTTVVDLGLLILFTIITFAGAFVLFLKYDLR